MSCVTIRGCRIGEGRTKVIIPIVERSETAVLERAAEFSTLRTDCVEWRADWLDAAADPRAIAHCLQGLRSALGDKLLLVTFRTQAEGGQKPLTLEQYTAFCEQVCSSGCADLLDLELFSAENTLPALITQAHTAGLRVVCSSHDFSGTPPRAELVARMVQMQQAGADIAKVAVMPRSRQDVLELLSATAEMAELHPETPVITMSMGSLGAVSRLCGEAIGSAMTFANAGQSSAPGQVELDLLNAVLDCLHK